MDDSLFSKKLIVKLYIPWAIMVLFACIFLSQTNYVSSSNDSRFYSEQVVRYYQSDFKEILTAKWGENYGFNPDSYMRDQFPGQLLIGIAGAKLGLPAKHSLHIIELIFQLLSILVMFNIANKFLGSIDSSIVFYALLIMPNAFSYNLRANHESGIVLFSALCLLSGLNLNKSFKWIFISCLSTFFLLFIKGPFALFGFILTFIGFFFSDEFKLFHKRLLFVMIFSLVLVLGFLIGFETIYKHFTGESFLTDFYRIQFQQRALELKVEHSFIIQKIINFLFYLRHLVTYSLPWSLLAIMALIFKRFQTDIFKRNNLAYLFLAATFSFCIIFSMSNRLASRYIYPAYSFFSVFCVILLFNCSDRFKNIHYKLVDKYFPIFIISIWTLAFLLHFI